MLAQIVVREAEKGNVTSVDEQINRCTYIEVKIEIIPIFLRYIRDKIELLNNNHYKMVIINKIYHNF